MPMVVRVLKRSVSRVLFVTTHDTYRHITIGHDYVPAGHSGSLQSYIAWYQITYIVWISVLVCVCVCAVCIIIFHVSVYVHSLLRHVNTIMQQL